MITKQFLFLILIGFHLINCSFGSNKTINLLIQAETFHYVGDNLIINILIDGKIDEDIILHGGIKSNKNSSTFLHCFDCRDKLLNENSNKTLQFTYKIISPAKFVFYIEEKKNSNSGLIINKRNKFIELNASRSYSLYAISNIIGWLYFFTWLGGFYPQIILNYKRQSCEGLNTDFVILNLTGFISYAIFNCVLYFSKSFQDDYERKNPYSEIPVLLNDLVFSVHHTILSFIMGFQAFFFYKNGNQKLSELCKISTTAVYSSVLILGYYVFIGVFPKLEFIYFFSYIKMYYTGIKYVPQAYFNYKRKSTIGWSLYYCLCDIAGSLFCLIQTFLMIYNFNDWSFLTYNLAKTGIALLTLIFDFTFIIQHYIYTHRSEMTDLNIMWTKKQYSKD